MKIAYIEEKQVLAQKGLSVEIDQVDLYFADLFDLSGVIGQFFSEEQKQVVDSVGQLIPHVLFVRSTLDPEYLE